MKCVVSHAPLPYLHLADRLLAGVPCTVTPSKSVACSCCCHCLQPLNTFILCMPDVADLALWACAGRVLGVLGRVLARRAADIPLPLSAAGARTLPGALAAALCRRPVRARHTRFYFMISCVSLCQRLGALSPALRAGSIACSDTCAAPLRAAKFLSSCVKPLNLNHREVYAGRRRAAASATASCRTGSRC